MGRLLIRQLDDVTKRQLRMRAAKKGHSMEQEAREILRTSLTSDVRENEHFVDAIRRRIAPLGGVDLPVIPRGPIPDPPKLDRRLFSTSTSSPNDCGPGPSPMVMMRLKTFLSEDRFTTAISEAELRLGLSILPRGRKRHALQSQVDGILREVFAGRILPFERSPSLC